MEFKEKIVNALGTVNHATFDYLGAIFANIYDELPNCYRVYFKSEKSTTYKVSYEYFPFLKQDIKHKIDVRALLEGIKKNSKKIGASVFSYSPNEYMILGDKEINENVPNFLMNLTVSDDLEVSSLYEEIWCEEKDIETVYKLIKDYIIISDKKDKCEFGITAVDGSGYLYTSWYDYNCPDINIKLNYNDDMPYDNICELVKREGKPDLMLFYGEPGTGKSSLIKHLIDKFTTKEFVFLDGGLLVNVQQDRLMSYFLENQNTIFILEDCEKALMDREHNYNPIMPILLNLTDGIIGDVLGIKLICTFNTNLNNVDKALLRKGRLSLKYEFKKLSKEKVRKILKDNSINSDMSLADVYNYKEENDFSKKNSKKIGF